MEKREFGEDLSSSVLWIKFRPSSQCCWLGFPWSALSCPGTVSAGVDVWISALAGLKPTVIISVLVPVSSLQAHYFCTMFLLVFFFFFFNKINFIYIFIFLYVFKVKMFLHYLWVGPLQAITVTALLWMETGMSCLAGMAVLIFLLLLQSCFGMWFSSLR